MSDQRDTKDDSPDISAEELAWAAANLPRVRGWVTGPLFVRQALIMACLLGLAAHVGGYALTSMAKGEPLRLLADLLATLGTTVWTGAVLVFFLEVVPKTRQRWAARRLAAYEEALRDEGLRDQ